MNTKEDLQMKSYNKWDLRVQKTYKLLHTSLITLLEKQSFDEITVQAICDEAMVHRTTFYAHFEDKYHLLSSCLDYIIEHEAVFTDITLWPDKCLKELIKIVDKYKDAFSQVISNKKASIQNILKKNMSEGIKQHIKESGHIYDSTHIDIIIAAYVASVLSILENYVAEDVEINEKDLDNIFNTLSRMFAS